MAKTTIVGKVSIRVWPDTRGFRKRLEAEVEKGSKGVEVEVDANVSDLSLTRSLKEAINKVNTLSKTNPAYRLKVYADIEVSQVKARLAQAFKEINSGTPFHLGNIALDAAQAAKDVADDIKRDLSKVSGITVKGDIKPAVSITDLNKARGEMQLALRNIAVDIVTTFDPRENFQRIQAYKKKLEAQLRGISAKIKADFDDSKAMAKFRAMQAKMHEFTLKIKPTLDNVATRWVKAELQEIFSKDKVKIKPGLSLKDVAEVKADLAAAFRAVKVKVKAVVDNKSVQAVATAFSALSGLRLTQELFDPSQLANLDKMLPKIALFATGIGQAASAAITAAGNIFSISKGLGEIVPAALALPGIFAGLATSALIVGVAFADITKQIPSLQGASKRLAGTIRTAFWDNARVPIADLVNNWMPRFRSGLSDASSHLGTAFGSIATSLNKVVTSHLDSWFDGVAKSADNFGTAAPGIAAIVANLGDLGAKFMPRLASAFAGLLNNWGDWLNSKAKTGELVDMVNTGVDRVKELGSVLSGAFGIVSGLSKAASKAGGSTLKSLADTLGKVSDAINSIQGQAQIANIFAAANQAMDNLYQGGGAGVAKLFERLSFLLPQLLPLIGQVAGQFLGMVSSALATPELSAGLMDFFMGLKAALQTIAPAFDDVGRGIGALGTILGNLVINVAPIITIALGALQHHAEGFATAINSAISSLGPGLLAVLTALLPGIQAIAPVVNGLITDISAAIGQILTEAAPGLGAMLSGMATGLQSVATALSPLLTLLGNSLGPILGTVATALGGVVSGVGGLLAGVITVGTAILNILLPAIQNIATTWGPQLATIFTTIGTAAQGIGDKIAILTNMLGPVLTPILSFLGSALVQSLIMPFQILGDVLTTLNNGLTALVGFIGATFPGALATASASTTTASTTVGTASTAIATSLGGINTAATSAVGSLTSLNDDGATRIGQLSTQANALTGTAKANVIANMAALRSQSLTELDALVTGSDKKFVDMAITANDKMADLADKIPTLTGKAKTAALEKLEGMRQDYDTKFGAINTAVQTKTSAQQGIVEQSTTGVANALSAPVTQGRKDIDDELDKVPAAIKKTFDDSRADLKASGKSMMQAIADGITDKVPAAVKAARDAMDAIRRVFPNSPAKDPQSAFHGKGWTLYSGEAIAESIGDGIANRLSYAKRSAEDLAKATSLPLRASALSGAANATVTARVEDSSSRQPITIGSLTIGPDDPEYELFAELASSIRRRTRARTGN